MPGGLARGGGMGGFGIDWYIIMQLRKVMTPYVVSLKQYNTQSRISREILEQCSLNLAPKLYIIKKTEKLYVRPIAQLPQQQLCSWSCFNLD